MNGILLDTAPLAIGIALSPLAIISIIVLLSLGNLRGSVWFLAGWILGLLLLAVVVAYFGQRLEARDRDVVRPLAGPVKVIFGVLLIAWSARSIIRSRNTPPPTELPKMLQAVDGIGPKGAFGMGAFMASINAKNVAIFIVFFVALASRPPSTVYTIGSVALFVILASLTILLPVLYVESKGDGANDQLQKWRAWMMANQGTIMSGMLGVIGLVMIVRGWTEWMAS